MSLIRLRSTPVPFLTLAAGALACGGDKVPTQPAAVPLTVAAVSTGETHACGRTAASVVYCWGDNYRGALGDGTTARDRATAVLVTGGVSFALIAVGSAHNCGLNTASVAYCWGGNQFGEIGDGTTTDRSTPVPVAGDLSFAAVSAGSLHSCGVTAAGAAYCWGQNIYGQLGDGTTTDRASPALVAGGVTFVAVSTGYSHTCGVTAVGAAYCWGSALSGELGDGTATFRRSTPVLVAGGLSFTAVSAGARYTCGVTDAHTAYCWGDDQFGEIGDGVTPNGGHSTPTLVAGGLSFAAVSAGRLHTCGVTVAGAAYCWGAREFGQLGDGATTGSQQCYDGDLGLVDCSVVPVPVAGGLTFAAVSTGNASACGVTTEGAAYCWGANNAGQLGDGTKTNQAIPVRVMQ